MADKREKEADSSDSPESLGLEDSAGSVNETTEINLGGGAVLRITIKFVLPGDASGGTGTVRSFKRPV